MSRLDRDNIKVKINDCAVFSSMGSNCLDVYWEVEGTGFGQWTMRIDSTGTPIISTECMDKGEDKRFSKAILEELLKMAVIED